MKGELIGLAGVVLYLVVFQHLWVTYLADKPQDSWLRIAWLGFPKLVRRRVPSMWRSLISDT